MNTTLDFLSRPANVAYNWLVMMTERSWGRDMLATITYEESLKDADFFRMLLAVQFGLKSVLVELLKSHTRPAENALDRVISRLACHAAKLGYREIVKLLLTKKGVDWDMCGFCGDKLLMLVAGWNDEDTLRILLQKESCSVNALANMGSALHWATRNGCTSIARILLEAGADVEARGSSSLSVIPEATPYLVTGGSWEEMMELLLEYKADINGQTFLGYTALHIVARCSTHAVEYLVSKGADLNLPDYYGNTPLDLVEKHSSGEVEAKIIRILREAGGKTGKEMVLLPGVLAAWKAMEARRYALIRHSFDQHQPPSTSYQSDYLIFPKPLPEHCPPPPELQCFNDPSTWQCDICKLYGHTMSNPYINRPPYWRI